MGGNCGIRNAVVPADSKNATEGFCIEGIEAFLLSFGKCP